MTDREKLDWINQASFEDLLRKWRFAPAGDPFLKGHIGDHFNKIYCQRRNSLDPGEFTRISKKIGLEHEK